MTTCKTLLEEPAATYVNLTRGFGVGWGAKRAGRVLQPMNRTAVPCSVSQTSESLEVMLAKAAGSVHKLGE